MSKAMHYESPLVLKSVSVEQEEDILAGSVVDQVPDVETAGQKVGDFIDISEGSDTFNHSWE